jgi:membrane protein
MLRRIKDFINQGLWETRLRDLTPGKALLFRCLRTAILAFRGFLGDDCQKRASLLTYYSMLNIVPIFAVVFGIAKGFGLEKLVESQILQMAAKANWQADITTQILGFSRSLLAHAKGGVIAGVGIAMLFWTVISILGKIEDSLNTIWEVRRARTLIRKFTDYISILFFAPVLLIISSSLTVVVASQVKVIVERIAVLGAFSKVIFFLLSFLPYVSIWVLLTMLYLVMPNRRIPLRSGILGGVVAGTVYQIVQWVYIRFQIGVTSYGAIYGSFAALPLFLAWLQLSWMIFLLGAEIASANGHYETYGFLPDYTRISSAVKKRLALRVFHLIIRRFSEGAKALTAGEIASTVEMPIRVAQGLLDEMTEVGLVVETVQGLKSEVAYQPGRTIEDLTVKYVLDALEQRGISEIPIPDSEEGKRISALLKEISEIIAKSPANIRLKEI